MIDNLNEALNIVTEKEKAAAIWKKMISDPEHAHEIVRCGRTGGNAPICNYLTQKILENEQEFFSKMKPRKLTHNIISDSDGYSRYGYYKREHGDAEKRKENSNRGEDLNSIAIYDKYKNVVIDRQTPLKDGSAAKPDLLLFDNGALIFGEAKKDDSTELLLRAVIEIERYYAFVNHEVLISDFTTACPRMKGKEVKYKKVQKAILVPSFSFKENNQGKKTFSLKDQLTSEEYKNVQSLIRKRHIFIIDADTLYQKGEILYFPGFSPQDYAFLN